MYKADKQADRKQLRTMTNSARDDVVTQADFTKQYSSTKGIIAQGHLLVAPNVIP